jgi:hypothetical protein
MAERFTSRQMLYRKLGLDELDAAHAKHGDVLGRILSQAK